jgi:hypothetical protein
LTSSWLLRRGNCYGSALAEDFVERVARDEMSAPDAVRMVAANLASYAQSMMAAGYSPSEIVMWERAAKAAYEERLSLYLKPLTDLPSLNPARVG